MMVLALSSCPSGNAIHTSSQGLSSKLVRLQEECIPVNVSIGDVNVSHLILGPDLMDLGLKNVQILHLNNFTIVKMREEDAGVGETC